jgi:hypothetical protein
LVNLRPFDATYGHSHSNRMVRPDYVATGLLSPANDDRELSPCPTASTMRRFLRFQTELRSPRTGRRLGLFRAIGELESVASWARWNEELLRESLRWFNHNLKVPRRNSHDLRSVFWFRHDASECLNQIWTLVAVLRDEGIWVDLYTCRRPGHIVYRDEHQVAAIPGRR